MAAKNSGVRKGESHPLHSLGLDYKYNDLINYANIFVML